MTTSPPFSVRVTCLVLLTLVLHTLAPSNCIAHEPTGPTTFARANKQTPLDPGWFRFSANGSSYEVLPSGQGTRRRPDGTSESFRLTTGKSDVIEEILYAPLPDGLIVIFQYRNDELDGAGASVTQLAEPRLSAKWTTHIPAFNVGPPLLAGSELYVTGFGFVGRLDISDGRYRWSHDGLYQPQGRDYQSFAQPRISGRVVEFPESITSPTRSPLVLKVDRETGEIMK